MLGCHEGEIGDRPEEWFDRIHDADRERVKEEIAAHQNNLILTSRVTPRAAQGWHLSLDAQSRGRRSRRFRKRFAYAGSQTTSRRKGL